MRRLSIVLLAVLLPILSATAQTITTVAGGGPNNVPALSAGLGFPAGVAVDGAGNFFIISSDLHRLFKVDATGLLTVVAGDGFAGFGGDGGPATGASLSDPRGVAVDAGGNVLIADSGNTRIRLVAAALTLPSDKGVSGL